MSLNDYEMIIRCTGEVPYGNSVIPKVMADTECYTWCADNPAACDPPKLDFCKKNPTHSLCGCLNAGSRPEFKSLMAKLPEAAHMIPLPCFLQSRCGEIDLYNVLIPESIRKQQRYCPHTLIDMSQTINCSNATCYNVKAEQEATAKDTKPGPGPGSVVTEGQVATESEEQRSAARHKIAVLLLFLAFLVAVITAAVWFYKRAASPADPAAT